MSHLQAQPGIEERKKKMALVTKLKQLSQSAKLGGIKARGPSARRSLTHQHNPGSLVHNLLTTISHVQSAGAPLISTVQGIITSTLRFASI